MAMACIATRRGNSMQFRVNPVINKQVYTLQEGEKVVVTVKRTVHEKKVLIQKEFTAENYTPSGYLFFNIEPEDYDLLPYKSVVLDAALVTADSFTIFIPPMKIFIDPAATAVPPRAETES